MTIPTVDLDQFTDAPEQRDQSPTGYSTTELDRIIGTNIRRQRTRAGLTQTALGDALGVKFQQIQKYEYATNRISASRLFELATFFKIDIRAFFHEG